MFESLRGDHFQLYFKHIQTKGTFKMYTLKIVERVNPTHTVDFRDDFNPLAVNLRESYHELSCDAVVVFFEDNSEGAVACVVDSEQKFYIYREVDAY